MKFLKKTMLDFLPFIIICISAIVSLIVMINSNYIIQWQHYLAIVFLVINGVFFYKHHQLGVLFLGLTILLGLTGVLSFNVGIVGTSAYWTPFGLQIPIFKGNPIFLIWLILHIVLSGRYYVGVITKKYWQQLINDLHKNNHTQ